MKTTLIILVLLVAVAVMVLLLARGKNKRYLSFEDIETKEGEVTQINLSDLDPNDPIAKLFRQTAQTQAAGLDDAKVTVHSVTEHESFRDATPHEGHKLVAVDVTFSGFKDGFGLAGIQLIDGEQQEAESYGGDPYQVYLKPDGTIDENQGYEWWDANCDAKEVRLFLVYSAPERVKKIVLGYWNRVIVDRPYGVTPPPPHFTAHIED